MLDIKLIRENPEKVEAALARRGKATVIEEILQRDGQWRSARARAEHLRRQRNLVSDEIARIKRGGGDASGLIAEMKKVSGSIKERDGDIREHEEYLKNMLLAIPNLPHESVPDGDEKTPWKLISEHGELEFGFAPLPHWEIGEKLGILDFSSAAGITGSNFPLYRGYGAKLERALYSFMLDLHVKEHGYEEIIPPYLVSRDSMLGTGQLPKLEGDMYHCEEDDLFLVPTAEVPLINIHREEIIDAERLPVNYVAYTPCFRREAGSYGKDTRGLMRVHQFDKVELISFTMPEESYRQLEKMRSHAEKVLRLLEIPYRVVELCAHELSFASAKTYDIEIWAPGVGRWLEVSSVSNSEDFQARRANIRGKRKREKGTFHPHTLNGSGVALARLYLSILELYQQPDCTIRIPDALIPYMGGTTVIGPHSSCAGAMKHHILACGS